LIEAFGVGKSDTPNAFLKKASSINFFSFIGLSSDMSGLARTRSRTSYRPAVQTGAGSHRLKQTESGMIPDIVSYAARQEDTSSEASDWRAACVLRFSIGFNDFLQHLAGRHTVLRLRSLST
jgi:hypothetical protein